MGSFRQEFITLIINLDLENAHFAWWIVDIRCSLILVYKFDTLALYLHQVFMKLITYSLIYSLIIIIISIYFQV